MRTPGLPGPQLIVLTSLRPQPYDTILEGLSVIGGACRTTSRKEGEISGSVASVEAPGVPSDNNCDGYDVIFDGDEMDSCRKLRNMPLRRWHYS